MSGVKGMAPGRFQEKSNSWKGDRVGYIGLHMWLYKNYGKADHCENDPTHVVKKYHWANISGKYLRDRNDFMQLCPSCHKKFDAVPRDTCRRGHPSALYAHITPQGWRQCRACRQIQRDASRRPGA